MSGLEDRLRAGPGGAPSGSAPGGSAPGGSAPGRFGTVDGEPLPDLSAAIAAAGLLDVAYVTEDSPVGRLLLAATPAGLVRVAYLAPGGPEHRDDGLDEDGVLQELATRISPRVLRAPARLDPARRELEEFFGGRRQAFAMPLDWQLARGFARQVLRATAAIPYGSVSSYASIAQRAGSPRAYRAAGTALGRNPLPIVIPCHRVLHSGGGLGGYTGGPERKRTLLAIEQGG
jgi:methylated-DNA-[protein]-cysteine S-methyltransferase